MTSKEFVKSKMPKAHAERQRTNGHKVYWLIRDGRASVWFAYGDTESKAWVAAAEKLRAKEGKESGDV